VSRRDETVAKGFTSYKREFDNADLMPSYWVDFRAAAVVEFDPGSASSLGWTDKEIADDLVKYVSRSVRERVPGGLSRASQVVKRLAGDSLGHAVLLTALLRGEGVPARVAVGLRYRAPDAAVMDFHAWTVAYHDGRWRSLDATFGKRPPADRITLAILNLREDPNSDPHRQLTEMLRTLGDLQIRLVGSESGQAEGESN
jgi:transglutaminase-like putative cysteine protease